MERLLIHSCLMIGILLSNNANANITTQNVEGVVITFLEEIKRSISSQILSKAISLKGIKYKYGGASPETGFDCSGFVNYVFNQAANIKLPRTTRGLSRIGESVDKQALQAGDLVFFNTRKRAFSHVGIYIGDGEFIHAPSTGSTVRVESMDASYWKLRFNGAKRLDKTEQGY